MTPRSAARTLLMACALLAGCGGGGSNGSPAAPSTPAPSPTPTSTPGATYPLVAAVGDIVCGPETQPSDVTCKQMETVELVIQQSPAAVLALGDLQYELGTYEQFANHYDRSWGRVKPITRPGLGNHEYAASAEAKGYFDYFNGIASTSGVAGQRGEGWYSFNLGGWHIIMLNSNCSRIGGCGANTAQERWLKADLAANAATCTLAFWHHPRFSSGPDGSAADMQTIWQDVYTAGVDVVLSGHDHAYERFGPMNATGGADPRGIRQFVVGTGGRSLYPFGTILPNSEVRSSNTFGILTMRLRPTGYDWEFVPIVGHTFRDSGSGECR
jgi:acid phosphatase type 7